MRKKLYALENSLNNIIDDEFKHNKCNSDLICEAVDGLLRLENFDKYIISSAEKNQRINEIFNQIQSRNRIVKRVVKVILVAALIAALMVGAVLAYVGIEYKITKYSDYSTVLVNFITDVKLDDLKVDYIPDGFEVVDITNTKMIKGISYTNTETDDFISIQKSSVKEHIINTEYEDMKIIKIGEIEYIIFGEKKHGQGVIWFTDKCSYMVSSSLSKEKMLKIAQTVR